ncbi:7-carboxy-7-deazaguanine synthase QueE [Mucilaginibacter sp. RS28]|uniref:7-carboxy-7-deazaguanine synthase n=1 Tax=Mucilaginibacter straminoryzae TaxID=2932774 RepID=A0A9X2BAX5_9SPHI|nr:7-carboxy-7-deazaguanine synthase QueE [Mucilaginibacter straminoryzae]MCJ8211230.1 7-carboxy-7-deazaguanine synthase QueE [Mucilaginibacter straminoryzae]
MAVQIPEDGTLLPLMEEFYTIQGEGYNTGKAAYFIRLGGCDVGCHWCDVKESWDAELHPLTPADVIVEHASRYPAKTVVITGGEPLIYNLDYLTGQLQNAGIRTFIETSGAYPLSGHWDWICLSPKKFKAPQPVIAQAAHELKVIVFNKSDFAWGEQYAEMVSPGCKLYFQPEWSKAKEVTPLVIDYVMNNPKWEISLQTHKYLNIP